MTLAKKQPKRQQKKPDFNAAHRANVYNYDPECTGKSIEADRKVNLKHTTGKLKAVEDALNAFSMRDAELPPHVRIAKLQRQLVRLRRSLVAQVVQKTRLRRELERIKNDDR
jgi:hypothetical protein